MYIRRYRFKKKYFFCIVLVLSFISFLSAPNRYFYLQEQTLSSLFQADALTIFKVIVRILMSISMLYVFLKFKNITTNRPTKIYLIYIVCCIFSLIYATNKSFAFMRLIEIIFMICLLLSIRDKFTVKQILNLNYIGYIAILSILWIVFLTNREDAFRVFYSDGKNVARFGGYILHPNTLGAICGILTMAFFFRMISCNKMNLKIRYMFIALISFYSMIITYSRTSIIATIISIYIMIIINKNRNKYTKIIFLILSMIIAILITILFGKDILNTLSRGDSIVSILSGTGRTELWGSLLQRSFMQKPILGFGFQNITNDGFIFEVNKNFVQTHAHNAFLQILLGTGMIGFSIFFISFIMLQYRIYKNYRHYKTNIDVELIGILVWLTINSISELGIGGTLSPIMILYLSVLINFDRREMN